MKSSAVIGALLTSVVIAPAVRAQSVISPTEQLAFDRPESWALQYFTTATFLQAFDPTAPDMAGSVAFQVESGWFPTLSPEQSQVGFGGTAAEDLNKAPLYVRPRVRVAVTRRLAITVGGVPPVRAFGVTPRLFNLAVEWAIVDNVWRVAARAHGQTGTVTGSFTCPQGVLAFAPGSSGNPTGCNATSADVATLRYGALELDVARRLETAKGLTPHAAITVSGIDTAFQVNAHTFGFIDHTRLETGGATWSTAAGASIPISRRAVLTGDVLYAPLFVTRTTGGSRTNDALFTVRGLLTYWIR